MDWSSDDKQVYYKVFNITDHLKNSSEKWEWDMNSILKKAQMSWFSNLCNVHLATQESPPFPSKCSLTQLNLCSSQCWWQLCLSAVTHWEDVWKKIRTALWLRWRIYTANKNIWLYLSFLKLTFLLFSLEMSFYKIFITKDLWFTKLLIIEF